MRSLLATLWQSDSAFPSGAFAFSNGLEGAAALEAPLNRALLARVVATTLRFRWATMDRLALLHAFHAEDLDRIGEIDRRFEAASVIEPLRIASRRNGAALLLSHHRLGAPGAETLRTSISERRALGHLPVVQGWIWRRCGLDEAGATAASAYTVATGLSNAAVRLGGVGAIDAQGVIRETLSLIEELCAEPFDANEPIAFSAITPWLDLAALAHARSDLRLFAS